MAPEAVRADGLGRPDLPGQRVSKVDEVTSLGAKKARQKAADEKKTNDAQARRAKAERRSAWPGQDEATVELVPGKTGKASPGGVPVTMRPTAATQAKSSKGSQVPDKDVEARLTVLDQKNTVGAGVTGVLLTVEADAPARADLKVDYSGFASALGGGWAQRLRLVQLPSCVLTTPEQAACRKQTPVGSHNNMHGQTVSAKVTLAATGAGKSPQLMRAGKTAGPAVFAVAAAGTGAGQSPKGAGDYSATKLDPSSSWQAGNSSGSFTWSYDFNAPPAAAGPTPKLALSYDSGSVDGRTATTNNQGTAVGEGFALTESYIERSYGSCDDDGHADVFDHCWKYDNARLVLNGKADRLVEGKKAGTWRLQNDNASTVTRSTGADNGDDNGEYWTVITGEGTKYVFGQNKLTGAGAQRTDSTWTVPVFGDDADEPGYDSGGSFGERAKTQAWRWNLDYVEDTRGNAATYWYAKETNHYEKNEAKTANTAYVRGGYLKEIKYGLRKGALFTDDADAKVTFSHKERCTASDCSKLTKDTADDWPDVPFDALCSDGDDDCDSAGPSFFSRKRLTGISTYSWAAASSKYEPVDTWTLTQRFLDGGDIGDTSDHVLTLQSLKRTGKSGTDIAMDPVTFTYQMRPNRVDATDDILPLTRPRMSTITSETGAITEATLSAPECVRSAVIDAPQDSNTRSCYPQFWNINGAEKASVDWFHKYRVLAVTVSDPTGRNEAVEHAYSYSGAAWRHADDPFVPKDERTWSDWRGYRQVTSYTGAEKTTRSKTVSLYMQGMDGDRNKDGTKKSVGVEPLSSPDLGVAAIKDGDQYAGQLREKVSFDGATPISATVNTPWSQETARQKAPDSDDHVARYIRTKNATTHTYLTASRKWRARTVSTDYDSYGMPSTVQDNGDDAKTGDETCTTSWYARNADEGIVNLPARTRLVGKACSVADKDLDLPADDSRRGDVLSDTAIAYDDAAWSTDQKPGKALVTWAGRAKGYTTGSAPTWQETSTTDHDALGRPILVTDAKKQETTKTAYTPAGSGPLTQTTTTNAKGHRTISFLDARRGLPLRTYDANQKKTELEYDAVGRTTSVWLPNRARGVQSPNRTFAYHLSNTEQSWVSTATLKKDGESYTTTYEIVDALLRPLQTQTPTPQGGRLLTDSRYDSRGLNYETYADIFDNTKKPEGTYARAEYGEAPKQKETVFDGAGRPTSDTLLVYGVKKWSTATTYTGDSTATAALKGGSATRGITDARGRTVESREYDGPSPADPDFGGGPGASYVGTKFTHTLDDQQTSITGADGAKWEYTYDLFGRRVTAKDPDKGTTTTEYDMLDQAVKTSDVRGRTILTDYDALGRTTDTWAGEKTEAKQLTARVYDTVLKGQPTSSTRYIGGKNGRAYTRTVTDYDSMTRPIATTLDLPADDPLVKAGQPSSLKYSSYYNLDGTLQNTKEPALGGLASEIIDYNYDDLGQVTQVGGLTGYLLGTDYSALGQIQQLTLGAANTEEHKKAYVTNTYEEGTDRLLRSHVTDQTHPYQLQDLNYRQDDAGNVTSITDTSSLGGTGAAETQCFSYDGHRRMTEAWAPASRKCSEPAAAGSLAGPAPYWNSYEYNKAGQRARETVHTGDGNTTTTYCYDTAQPHTLTGTTTKDDCAAPERRYGYDKTGNTTARPGPAGTTGSQNLAWSEEGKLTKLTQGGKDTDYVYDADGNLLIRASEGGERVLYAGATELHLKADGGTWAQRRYTVGGTTVAVRSNESGKQQVFYQAGDHHGTQSLSIGADSTQAVRKRYLSPFGAERGKAVGTWPDDKGFLGMTDDKATGLTHVGAREYDPAIGQFLSVDPVLDSSAPQTLNGYSYASNNPASFSDPTGLHQMMQNGGGDDSNAQNDFIESHASPDFGSGATWSSTYSNFPGGGGGGGGTAQGWAPAAKPCGVVPMAPCAGTAPLIGPAPIFLPYIHPGVASPQYQMARYCGAYPIDRACNPQDAVRGGGNDSLQKIVGQFMLGKLDRYETYGEDSKVALQVMMTDLTAAHRAEIAKRYYELGKKSGSLDPNSIGGKSTSGKAQQLGSDAKSVLTGDANVATAILGSYTTKYKILRANSTGIQARITIHNSMSVSSLTHYATGYGTSAERFVSRWVDNDGIIAFGGAAHQQDMTIVFRAVIPVRGGVLGGPPVQ
ncbi:RHS repeat-associated core domain-containing protein [Streptomyces sp. DSM 118878]